MYLLESLTYKQTGTDYILLQLFNFYNKLIRPFTQNLALFMLQFLCEVFCKESFVLDKSNPIRHMGLMIKG